MKGGQSRLPARIKAARGTLRRDRENPHAPRVSAGQVPDEPESLSPAETETWLRLADEVEALGVYTSAYFTSFKQLVRLCCLAETSDPFATPLSAYARLQQTCASALASWGLTPASTGRVSAAPVRLADDPLDEFCDSPGQSYAGATVHRR